MSQDYGMLFESTVTKIFGKPKSTIYFSNYYDTNEKVFKAMLLIMCIHELNYNPDKYDESEIKKLREYQTKVDKNENDRSADLEFLKYLNEIIK